jgi:sigma-B regulation protein RsbU (phosphoserine phosphatase)
MLRARFSTRGRLPVLGKVGKRYATRVFRLEIGDILVVYSDGLTDAQNQQGEMFGEARLLTIVHREAPSGSHALERKFLNAIAEFTGSSPQTDDITFVVVERYR